jgi:DNA-binding NarL/FixJ family response regulator
MTNELYIFVDNYPGMISGLKLFFADKFPCQQLKFFEHPYKVVPYLQSVSFDRAFIVVDYEMPMLNGLELACQLKDMFVDRVKVLMFSSLVHRELASYAIKHGRLDAHISKDCVESIEDVYLKLLEMRCA